MKDPAALLAGRHGGCRVSVPHYYRVCGWDRRRVCCNDLSPDSSGGRCRLTSSSITRPTARASRRRSTCWFDHLICRAIAHPGHSTRFVAKRQRRRAIPGGNDRGAGFGAFMPRAQVLPQPHRGRESVLGDRGNGIHWAVKCDVLLVMAMGHTPATGSKIYYLTMANRLRAGVPAAHNSWKM